MIQSILPLIATLAISVFLSFTLLFLPAIVELRKPRDAGPRFMTDSFSQIHLSTLKTSLLDIEDGSKFDSQLASKIWGSLSFISNLEA
jgi:hypothetical protein